MTMGGRLSGAVAVVTGASRGIGEATARVFIEHGAKVMLADVDPHGEQLAASLGPAARFVRADVTSPQDWTAIFASAEAQFGPVDVLVNNAAGSIGVRSIEEETEEAHRYLVKLNQTSYWLGMRTAVAHMRVHGGGSIVNLSSIDGLVGVPDHTTYVATKFAVTGMTRALALEVGKYGIRVNSVHPGITATPRVLGAADETQRRLEAAIRDQPIPRMGDPREIAMAVLFFASGESSYCTGSSLVVDGGHIAGPARQRWDADLG